MFLYPWGDMHSLNLGWFLLQFKDWVEKIQEYLDNGGGTSENLANVIAPVFNAANSYLTGDYVMYNDELYKANEAVSPGTWDPDKWTRCLAMEEISSGAGIDNVARLMIAGQYSASYGYQKYAICRYSDKLWMCNTNLPSGGEEWEPAHWDEITVGAGLTGLRRSVENLTSQKVSKTGDTMTGALRCQAGYVSNGSYDTNQWSAEIYFQDANGVNIGQFRTGHLANGNEIAEFFSRRNISGIDVFNALRLGIKPNGDKYVEFNAIGDENAWRIALGLGTDGALPITPAQGGTGQSSLDIFSIDRQTTISVDPATDTTILDYNTGFYRIALSATNYLPDRYGVLEIIKAADYGIARFTKVNANDLKIWCRTFNTVNKTWYNPSWVSVI